MEEPQYGPPYVKNKSYYGPPYVKNEIENGLGIRMWTKNINS